MALVFTLCAAYVAYCLGTNPAGPHTSPDSYHYLNATPIVPLGYPLFLNIAGARGAIVVQPILYGAALAFLGREIVRHTRSTVLALAVVAACMALPQMREFHATLITESLFASLIVLFLGLCVRFAYHPTWHLMVLVAIAVGVNATVRRTAFAFVPVMLLMVLLKRQQLRGSQPGRPAPLGHGKPALFLVAAVAPFLVIVGAEQAAAPVVHAGQSSSLFGRHMFAKAALIDAPPAPRLDDPVRRVLNYHLEDDYARLRSYLASAPYDLRSALALTYETCLQGGCADRSRALMPELTEAQQTAILGEVARARIARAPLAYAQLTAMNYRSLWIVDRLRHPDRARELTAWVAAHRPMPFEVMAFGLGPGHVLQFQGVPRVRYMQWVMTAVGIFTGTLAVIGIAAALWIPGLPPLFAVAAIAALAAHGGLLLTALTAAGYSRFMQGLWPAVATATVCGLWAVVFGRITAR